MEGDSDGTRLTDEGLDLAEEESKQTSSDRTRARREPRSTSSTQQDDSKRGEPTPPDLRNLLAHAKTGGIGEGQLNKNLLNLLKNQVKVTENFSTAMKDKLGRKDSKISEMEAEMEELRHKLRKLEKGSQDDHRKSRKKNELEDELSRTKRKLERERSRIANRLEPIAETFEQHEDSGFCRWSYLLWGIVLLLNLAVLSAYFFPNFSRQLSTEASSILKLNQDPQSGIFLSQAQSRLSGLEVAVAASRKAEKECLEALKATNDAWKLANETQIAVVCDSRSCQGKLKQCQLDLETKGSELPPFASLGPNGEAITDLAQCQLSLQACAERLPQEPENHMDGGDSLARCTRVLHGAQRSFADCKKQSSEFEQEIEVLRNQTGELNQSLLVCLHNLTISSSSLQPIQDRKHPDNSGDGVCLNNSEPREPRSCEVPVRNEAGAQQLRSDLTALEAKLNDLMQFDAGVIDALMNQATLTRIQLENALEFAEANSTKLAACSSHVALCEEDLDSEIAKLRLADDEILRLDKVVETTEERLKDCAVDLAESRTLFTTLEAQRERERLQAQNELADKTTQLAKAHAEMKSVEKAQKLMDIGYLDCENSVKQLTNRVANLTAQSQELRLNNKVCIEEIVKAKQVHQKLELKGRQELSNCSSELDICRAKKVEPLHDSDTCMARLESVQRAVGKITSLESGVRKTYLEMLQNKTQEYNRCSEEVATLQQDNLHIVKLQSLLQTCHHDKQLADQQIIDLTKQANAESHTSLTACEQEKNNLSRENEMIATKVQSCEQEKQALSEASDSSTTLRLSLQACEAERQNLHGSDHLRNLQSSLEACQREMETVNQVDNSELQLSLQTCNNEKQRLLQLNHDHMPASSVISEETQELLTTCNNRQKQLERETQVVTEQKLLLEKRNMLLESENNALVQQNAALNESLQHIGSSVVHFDDRHTEDAMRGIHLDPEAKRNAGALLAVWLALSERQDSRTLNFENELSNSEQIRSLLSLKDDVQTLLRNDLVDHDVVELGQKVLNVLPGLGSKCNLTEQSKAPVNVQDLLTVDFRQLLSNVSLPSYETVVSLRSLARDFSIQEWDIVTKGCWLFMVVSLDISLFQAFLPYSRFGILLVFLLWTGLTVYCFVLRRKICMALFACNALLGFIFLIRPTLALRFCASKKSHS